MNRFFGTRFNVASTRCTDGIWISVCEIIISENESEFFIIMDCEGLFSARRNDQEEMKLCLALAAVSDIMILNQDLSFNKYLYLLFTNFSKGIGRIKGKKLFKGFLLMLIRDVKNEDSDGAYKELMASITPITSKENNFLSSLFQGKLKSQCLNYFEQPIFNEEINLIRKDYFLSLNDKRWVNGRDFLESCKITLSQIFVDDDTDMDLHRMNIMSEHLFKECLKFFYEGEGIFKTQNLFFENEYSYNGELKKVNIRHDQIKFELEEIANEIDRKKSYPAEELIIAFVDKTLNYSRINHNEWVTNISKFIDSFLQERKEIVIHYFESQSSGEAEYQSILKNMIGKLNLVLTNFCNLIKFCSKMCRKCERLCQDFYNHSGDCDCKTGHRCELICDRTKECESNKYLCLEIYGHEGKHRCNEGRHMCDRYCDIGDEKSKCTNLCGYEAGHVDPIDHNCKNAHPCPKKCEDSICSRSCKFDSLIDHEIHECGETRCVHKCVLCDSTCIFNHHLHNKLINEGNSSKLYYKEGEQNFLLDYHICGADHCCGENKKSKCEKKGVCQVDFNIKENLWKNEFGEFNYTYYEPKESRLFCSIMIPKYHQIHKEPHRCSLEDSHRCSNQCPECKSFCNLPIDHPGLHSTKTHRNKENSVFISTKGKEIVEIKSEGKTKVFKVGENCKPENCSSSCSRRGRAHFHLRECQGEDKCEAKLHSFVKHSTERFHPFEEKIFDMWLCEQYWNSLNWQAPVEGLSNELCNYICGHYSHKDEYSYCNKKAWHEGSHSFECKHEEGYSSNIIDIVFCCDTTGSMGDYIQKSKNTVKKIIQMAKLKSPDRSVLFGFVAYRDHPPQDSSYVTQVRNLCDEDSVVSFISTLKADGGGDGSEAVLDGLRDSIHSISWRKDSMRYIFHIADAPPHGKEYTGGSGDGFPDGCPCGLSIEKLSNDIQLNHIKYKLLKIGSYPNTMASIFRSKIKGYEETELDGAINLETKVTEIVVRDIKAEDIDFIS